MKSTTRRDCETLRSRIPPTQLVDCSYSAYKGRERAAPRIPPTQLVDCSYSAYKDRRASAPNPTKALVDCLPLRCYAALLRRPVLFESDVGPRFVRLSMNDPPTALVGFAEARGGLKRLRKSSMQGFTDSADVIKANCGMLAAP